MKKSLSLLLALVLVLALCACGSSPAPAPAANPAPADAPANNSAPAAEPANNSAPADAPAADVQWPTGDVTVYVPASVGAPLDLAARVMCDWLTQYTGCNFVVENDEVGAGALAAEKTCAAAPDGQILMFAGSGQIVSYYNGTWDRNTANPDDFTIVAVSIQQRQPSGAVIVTQPDKPYDDWQGFVDYVNDNPNTVTVGIVNGTPHEVRLKLLLDYFGIADKVRYVSCTNTDVNTGILGGNIDIACLTETVGPQYITEGQVKGLIYSNYERNYKRSETTECLDSILMISDIVTDNPETLCCAWDIFLVGPPHMNEELVAKISDACAAITEDAEFMQRVYDLGSTNDYVPKTHEELVAAAQLAETQIKEVFGDRE